MKTLPKEDNLIVDLTFRFAIDIVEYAEKLEANRKYILARQLLKSGTSIGANVHEAQNAESDDDFIHKMKVAAKEMDESIYWLRICSHSYGYPDTSNLMKQIYSIQNVLNKIIATSKRNRN